MEQMYDSKMKELGYNQLVCDIFANWEDVKDEIQSKLGIDATLINPRFMTGLDVEMLENLKKDHDLVVTLEDGMLDGGFGEKIARFYGDSSMKVLNFGGGKEFTDREALDDLYARYHLKKDFIVEDIKSVLDDVCLA
jgi:1-deoxy-D-xylulose-5-phosphate synthase